MVSYYYDLLKDGTWGYQKSNDGILKVDVHAQAVYLTAYEGGVSYNGQALDPWGPCRNHTSLGTFNPLLVKHSLLE